MHDPVLCMACSCRNRLRRHSVWGPVVTRWFARTGAASAVSGVWVILHSLWAAGLS
jgi:hypothetical protein